VSQAASAFSSRKARSRVDETVDALACEQLAARSVALDRALPAAGRDLRRARTELRDERLHPRAAPREVVGALDAALQEGHREEPNGASGMLPA